ncbi:MAG TPA: hypothetical protein VK019_07520 [Pseudomonas sp.]|nr:hypothetical protein [Pseudomonas sp.]
MEIEVFPSAEALTVIRHEGGISLRQVCPILGKEVSIFVPIGYVPALCKALRKAADAPEPTEG